MRPRFGVSHSGLPVTSASPSASALGLPDAYRPRTAQARTSNRGPDTRLRRSGKPTRTPKSHAASSDTDIASTNDPCPVLALAAVRSDVSTTLWCRQLHKMEKVAFTGQAPTPMQEPLVGCGPRLPTELQRKEPEPVPLRLPSA